MVAVSSGLGCDGIETALPGMGMGIAIAHYGVCLAYLRFRGCRHLVEHLAVALASMEYT